MKARVDSSSGELILRDFKIHGLPVFVTTAITEDKVLAADFSFLKLVYFGAPQIVVDPYREATSGAVHVNLFNFMDLGVTYEAASALVPSNRRRVRAAGCRSKQLAFPLGAAAPSHRGVLVAEAIPPAPFTRGSDASQRQPTTSPS